MILTSYFDSSIKIEDLNPTIEYIFSFKPFSRLGNLEISHHQFMLKAIDKGIKCVLEVDILLTENDFGLLQKNLSSLDPRMLKLVRLQDPGVIHYFLENYPESDIQLVLETGNHNLVGIQAWCDLIKDRLNRVILSIELPKEKLKHIISELKVPVEILGFGPILIFYTPRKLLTGALAEESLNDDELYAIGKSEESPHKGFPIYENDHGTFMYHIKDFCLLDEISELVEMGLSSFRFDPRTTKRFDLINDVANLLKSNQSNESVRIRYGRDLMKGYYRVNKSDVLFSKLKNKRIKREDLSFCGNVLEVSKEHYVAIEVKEKEIEVGCELKFITPEGKEFTSTVKSLRSTSLNDLDLIPAGNIALVNYKRGVWPKSVVYYL